MKKYTIGETNRNNQTVIKVVGPSDTHYNQTFYELECGDCKHRYNSNGCDVWQRKCPKCQGGTA